MTDEDKLKVVRLGQLDKFKQMNDQIYLGADEVSDWAKASSKPTYTKNDVGLGNVTNDAQVKASEKGVNNGVATLDGNGKLTSTQLPGNVVTLDANNKIPASQIPGSVDEIKEGYLKTADGKFYGTKSGTSYSSEISGEGDKIYVDLDTNKTYRWSGSEFVEISASLALGETSSTAYRGDRGKTAYDHSQSTHARVDATKVESSSTNGNIKIDGTETTVYTHPSATAAAAAAKKVGMDDKGHVVLGDALGKGDVGLGNVTNDRQVKGLSSGTTEGNVMTFGADGYTVADSGKTLGKSVPADAVFTDRSVTAAENHYTPTKSNAAGATKTASGATGASGASVQVVIGIETDGKGHITGVLSGATTDTTYSAATTSSDGLMSATDKAKLDGITFATDSDIEALFA